jgi:hypothetical protein
MINKLVPALVISLGMIAYGHGESLLDNTFVSPYVNMFTWKVGVTPVDWGGNRYELGQSFITGDNLFHNIIYQPRFGSTGNGQESLVLSLYSDSNNAPNLLLGQFSGSAVPTVGSDNLYYLDPSLTLSSSTKYWVVANNTGAGLVDINSTADKSISTSNGFTVGDVGIIYNGSWQIVRSVGDPNYQPTVFKLSGSAVPEPSSLSLLALGGAVVALCRRKRA